MTRQRLSIVSLIGGTAILSACGGGGGGGGVASTPAPVAQAALVRTENRDVTPLEPNPAWSSGIYDALAIDRNSGKAEPTGAVRISVDGASKTYALTISAGSFPAMATTYDFSAAGSEIPIGSRYGMVQRMSDGTTVADQQLYYQTSSDRVSEVQRDADTRVRTHLTVDGPEPRPVGSLTPPTHYTALGEWGFSESKRQNDGSFADTGREFSAYLAFGDRTPASDIPVSGTARYAIADEREDFWACDYICSIPDIRSTTSLTVDFAARAIEAAYKWSSTEDGYRFSVGADGRSPIDDNGSFAIGLAGVGSARNDGANHPDQTTAVNGQISGAFFGPQAVEMGGVYRLPSLGVDDQGNLTVKSSIGAFTAVQSKP